MHHTEGTSSGFIFPLLIKQGRPSPSPAARSQREPENPEGTEYDGENAVASFRFPISIHPLYRMKAVFIFLSMSCLLEVKGSGGLIHHPRPHHHHHCHRHHHREKWVFLCPPVLWEML